MLQKNSIAGKFFISFLLVSTLVVSAIILAVYFSIKTNIINEKTAQLEIIHNIKYKQLQNAIQNIQNPLLSFIRDNYQLYGFDILENEYRKLPDYFSDQESRVCSEELLQYFTSHYNNEPVISYMHINSSDGIPVNKSGILAQCIHLPYNAGISRIEGVNLNKSNLKIYKELYNKTTNALKSLINIDGFQSVLFISDNDEIFYSSDKSSVLGHNGVTSHWIKGLSQSLSKFHNMKQLDNQEYFFIDMQPYTAIEGYPVFYIAAPIFENNKYRGSIVLVLTSKFLDNILSNSYDYESEGLGKTGDVFLTSNTGTYRSNKRQLIEDPDNYIITLKVLYKDNTAYDMLEKFQTTEYYSSLFEPMPFKTYKDSKGYIFSKTYNSKEVAAYYAPVYIGSLKWIMFVSMEMHEITSGLNGLNILLVKIIIPLFIILIFTAAIFSYVITKPVRQLNDVCAAFADGNTDYEQIKAPYREVSSLINSFSKISSNLEESNNKLEVLKKELEESVLSQSITARELKEERNFISKVLDARGFIILIIDEQDRIVRYNQVMPRLFPNSQIIGEKYDVFLPEEYKKRVAYILSLVRMGSDNIPHFISSAMVDGKKVYVEWNFSTFTGRELEDGSKEVFITAIGMNITERYEALETSKENDAMFHKIFSNAYDALVIADEDNNILLVNKSFEILFDIDYVDLIGKPVIPNIFSQEYANVISSDSKDGKSIEIDALRADKSPFPVDLSISKIIYKGKTSILYILRDASLKRQRERELQAALNRAREAERTKSEFLANMSHEIRTPLNGIIGFIDLLKDTQLDNAQREYIKIISNSSDSLFNIINDILDFSKIESGKMNLEQIEFNIWNVFEDSVAIYAANAMDKNIILLCLFSTDIPKYLIGDPLRIKQIITNLISNAIKFTDNNGRVIFRVNLLFYDKDTCKMRISVKDNGIGISKEQQKVIMEPFSQGDSSTTRKYGGSGLGLAISKSLTSSMGSTLNVFSESGNGSEFYFTLELKVASKKEKRSKVDFGDTSILLLGCDENCPAKELYEEYIRNVKANVRYTTNVEDLNNEDVKVVGISYDNNDIDFIKDIVSKHEDKSFIIFSLTPSDNQIFDIGGRNVFPLMPPFTVTKLIDILSEILGINKASLLSSKKEKSAVFKGNVLLVDDNEVNLKLSEILLKNLGLTVVTSDNGFDALEKYKQNNFDIVFMDIYMPEMDGLATAEAMIMYEREVNKTHTPIVALTANVMEEDIESYISIGMDDFVAKPIVKSKLEAILNRYLSQDVSALNDELTLGVAEYLKTDNEEKIYNAINEYCHNCWHYAQSLFHAVTEFNEGSSLYIVDKMIMLSENYKFNDSIAILNKIRQNIENGMNDNIFSFIDELKDIIYKIKRSIRYFKQ